MKSHRERKSRIFPKASAFKYAWKGITFLFVSQLNARFHLLAASVVIIAGFMLGLSPAEWVLIILTIAMVISAEAFNSAIEMLVDEWSPDYKESAGKIKDLAAGAVLITAIAAALIGLIIFIPRIFLLFSQ